MIAEIVDHPFWLKTQYQEALDPTQPRARVRELILFVRDKLNQARARIDKVTNPFNARNHAFLTMMEEMGGKPMETLEPHILDMEVTMLIDCFMAMPGLGVPRSFFDQWLWNHARQRRGCESHMGLIRNLFQQQTNNKGNNWTFAQAQKAMVLCTDWFVVIRSAQLYEDVYMLCYLSTKAHVWKTLEQRALH
ncbi:MAG: hypothetical protein GY821_00005, partial [Gammaproteobacteria bacterium]|nr:hypothetical protein [Gammaproteobacteria bacterium]